MERMNKNKPNCDWSLIIIYNIFQQIVFEIAPNRRLVKKKRVPNSWNIRKEETDFPYFKKKRIETFFYLGEKNFKLFLMKFRCSEKLYYE